MPNQPYLSVIIPVYNELSRKENEFTSNLQQIFEYLNKKEVDYEIIVVDDGSSDGSAARVKEMYRDAKNFIVIERKNNCGKWFTIREGFAKATGKYRLFSDADGSTAIHNLEKFWPVMTSGADIIIGSRDLKDSLISKHQPVWKETLGHWGSTLTRFVIGLPKIKDTQCGFKLLSERATAQLMPKLTINRWGGDFELLALATKQGFSIVEIPVVWVDTGKSLVKISGYLSTLIDLVKVKCRLIRGKYN